MSYGCYLSWDLFDISFSHVNFWKRFLFKLSIQASSIHPVVLPLSYAAAKKCLNKFSTMKCKIAKNCLDTISALIWMSSKCKISWNITITFKCKMHKHKQVQRPPACGRSKRKNGEKKHKGGSQMQGFNFKAKCPQNSGSNKSTQLP